MVRWTAPAKDDLQSLIHRFGKSSKKQSHQLGYPLLGAIHVEQGWSLPWDTFQLLLANSAAMPLPPASVSNTTMGLMPPAWFHGATLTLSTLFWKSKQKHQYDANAGLVWQRHLQIFWIQARYHEAKQTSSNWWNPCLFCSIRSHWQNTFLLSFSDLLIHCLQVSRSGKLIAEI